MPNSNEIILQILERSGLDRKDGHSLYRYRVTSEELDLLRRELKSHFDSRGNLRMAEECAAFCLFGAEWFRRNYRSGPWSWDVIFDALDLGENRRPNTQVTVAEYVKRGLKFWNVRLLSTQLMNLYLRTLVCQGGFPINTLRNDGAGLSRMLKACLRDHERFPTESMDEILSRYIHFVSLTLQIGEVRRLAVDLVQAIASLRKQSDEAQTQGITRREYLDQTVNGWESQLPLRVEEPEAKELLLSLLDAAKAEPFSRHALSLSTSMAIDGNVAFVIRNLRCPSTLTEEDFRRVCRFDANAEILPRMTGYLQAGDQRVPAISVSRSSDGKTFRLTKLTVASLSGDHAFNETALILAVGGEELQRVMLPGGEALPESPWIFTSDDSHQLIGVGSARPRDESVLIALPSDCNLTLENTAEVKDVGCSIAGRRIVKLTGMLSLRCEDVLYRITTKSDASRDCLYELRGTRRRLGTGGSEVWCGPPTVWQIPLNEDEVPSEVQHEQVQWKPVTGGQWNNNFDSCLGHIQIRVCKDGDTRYLVRCIVMPSRIELKVLPSATPGSGVLQISGLGNCQLAVERDENVTTAAYRKDGVVLIQVDVKGKRPGLLRLRITFSNRNSCEVSFVCPTTCYAILNALGQPVDYPTGIPAEKLDGLTLQVIQPELRAPLIYWPDGSLLIDRMRETNVPGVFEFPLSYISNYSMELLACSDEPDGKVTFGVGNNVAFQPKFRWHVSRYSHALDRIKPLGQIEGDEESTEICVKGLAAVTELSDRAYELTVVPLGSPNDQMPRDSIETNSNGTWKVKHAGYSPGYYLALAKDSKGNGFRPLRFVVKASEINRSSASNGEEQPKFLSVMNMYDKKSRLNAWDQYFSEIATDLAHRDWSQLDDLVNSSETLPITTFEAVAAITRNHYAAARYGILFPNRERLWRRFEQLPFLWSAIPIDAWLKTAAKCRKFAEQRLREVGMPDDQISTFIGQQRDLFVNDAPNRSMHIASVVLAMFASNRFDIAFSDELHHLFGRLSIATRQREHTRLIVHHDRFDTRSTWPNFRIDCTQQERDLLRSAGLLINELHGNQWAVLNGPGISAVKVVHGSGIPSSDIAEYKRLRALDPDWYDTANAVAMGILLQKKCESEPTYFANLLESLDT